jgi:predicted glycoside hydrolase/deacetylase ChbG (UPF0249 family)
VQGVWGSTNVLREPMGPMRLMRLTRESHKFHAITTLSADHVDTHSHCHSPPPGS